MINWKKVVGTTVLSSAIIFSSFAPMFSFQSGSTAVNAATHEVKEPATTHLFGQHHSGPFDVGVVNEERVLDLLVEEGVIDGDLSPEEQYKELRKYLAKRAADAQEQALSEKELFQLRQGAQELKGINPDSAPLSASISNFAEESWNGNVRTDKALVLLIEFPDYQHNNITEEDGPVLLYDDFTPEHYENMIFSPDGYVGPNGEDYISLNEFYIQQSGGSYKVEGQASDWYMAAHPAAYYGGNDPQPDGNDARPDELIKEALIAAAEDPNINLEEYDQLDPMDIDGDGDIYEPDGVIDNLMVVHAGVGEEAGGGALGGDAIWSHKSQIYTQVGTKLEPWKIPGTDLAASTYMIMPEDGAAGVFAHEYGHGLGLPDEYDTQYTALGSTTASWSIMSSGSWAGVVPGTEPTGFSAYAKEFLQDTMPGSNWFHDVEYTLEEIQQMGGAEVVLDQASVKGENADAVKISLPDKVTTINTPVEGEYEYYGGKGNEMENSMVATIDLTNATESATLYHSLWYDIEPFWDFAFVQVSEDGGETWTSLATPNTTTEMDPSAYPSIPGNLPGYTGNSDGWIHEEIDLSDYVGKEIQLRYLYITDWASTLTGIFVDDVRITADGEEVFADGAEDGQDSFTLDGFTKETGTDVTEHYYLIEWRNYAAADTALQHIGFGRSLFAYDPGMLIWYVDNKFDNNWVADHPGEGFLNVVDAHRYLSLWYDTDPNDGIDFGTPDEPTGYVVDTDFQIADAAFSLNETVEKSVDLSYLPAQGRATDLHSLPAVATFDDSIDQLVYDSAIGTVRYPYVGTSVPNYGLKIHVVDQAEDMSTGTIAFHVGEEQTIEMNPLEKELYSAQEGYNQVVVSGTIHHDGAEDKIALSYTILDSDGEAYADGTEELIGNYTHFEQVFDITESMPSGEYTFRVTAAPAVVGEEPVTFADGDLVAEVSFKVDNDAPVIELLGDNPMELNAGDEFVDPGYKATDEQDGDLTDEVVVVSDVDTSVAGEYTVTYTVADSAGNEASAIRTVIVKPVVEPGDDDDDGEDPGDDDGEDPGDDDQGDDGGTTGDGDKKGGGNLPNTATNIFNWLLAGSLALLAGVVLYFIHRRKASVIE
jgi:immune inhibitor A